MQPLSPDYFTALGMTALAAWSLAWMQWVMGRSYWHQGLAHSMAAMIFFGISYALFALETRIPLMLLKATGMASINVAVACFTLSLQRFRGSTRTIRDALTVLIPVVFTALITIHCLPHNTIMFNALHSQLTLLQMVVILYLLWRIRPSAPGKGWRLVTFLMVLQSAALVPMAFMALPNASSESFDTDLLSMLGHWLICLVMFMNLVLTSIGILLMMRDRQHALEQDRARLDPLTQLPMRAAFVQALQNTITQSAQQQQSMAVLLLDIDHFKSFNDQHGHLAGDRVIQMVANVLQTQLRKGDMAARYGGEEFVLLLPNTSSLEAQRLAQRLCESVRTIRLQLDNGVCLSVTISIGVHASNVRQIMKWELWIEAADAAMYQAKKNGRNQVVLSQGSIAA